MEDDTFKFFKTTLVAIIGILLILLAVVGIIAVFIGNSDYGSQQTTYPQTTTNIYRAEEKQESQQGQPTNYQQPLPNQANNYPQQDQKNINIQTTVNVRTSGYSYYPRYSRYYYRPYSYRSRYSYPTPYGYNNRYYSGYRGYGRNIVRFGRY